jgi:hypothetical protein
MVFCNLKYKSYGITDIHPYNKWVDMVNKNIKYCQTFNIIKWIVFYFYRINNRIKPHELPSFHPYWKMKVKQDMRKKLNRLIDNYNECIENPEMTKYYFNKDTSLMKVEQQIYVYQRLIKCY